MKLRIAAAAAAGVILIGVLAWPIVQPPEAFGAVSVLSGTIHLSSAIVLVGLAFLAGFIAYFLSWPYGREIGILAAPAGLSVWAMRSGSVAALCQQNPTLAQRQELFATLKWEPIFWLAIVAAGFAGVLMADKIRAKPEPNEAQKKANSKTNMHLKAIIALLGSVLIAQFCIRIFAQDIFPRDIGIFDEKLGSVVAQPAVGQIVFAVLVSFGIAGFVVKKFLDVSYIWPIASTAFVTFFAISIYTKQNLLQQLSERFPPVFFPHAAISILPVQMVAFGTLGSIAGFWLAVRYNYWRKHG